LEFLVFIHGWTKSSNNLETKIRYEIAADHAKLALDEMGE